MHTWIRWFIVNPVAANLIMVLILVSGIITLFTMRIEGFPKLPADALQIDTLYPDAYTQQVDEDITQKIETVLEDVPGIKKIQSTSLEELSSVIVQRKEGYPLQRLLNDVRMRIERIDNFPQAADRPIITRQDFDFPALIVQLYGQTDPNTLQRIGRQVREALLAQPEISKLKRWGEQKSEIHIEADPQALEKHGLTINDVVEAIQRNSLTFKSGLIKNQKNRIALRADKQANYAIDFNDIPIFTRPDGSQLRLGDISEIADRFENDDIIVRFNGLPALGMEVLIGRTENVIDITRAVEKTVADLQEQLPAEITLQTWADSGDYISQRLNLLKTNAFQGLALVFILLALFLNLKLAFWVAVGIPISVAGALAVMGMDWINYSLNDVTTFGIIIALGLLVDDAVVVGESVFDERQHTPNVIQGTAQGVEYVATATIYGVLTSVAALFPLLLIDNALGKIMASFAGVVIIALLFSLFESKFILPAHLASISLEKTETKSVFARLWQTIQNFAQHKLNLFRDHVYRPLLIWSLRHRYAVLLFFITAAVFALGIMGSGKLKTVFIPDIPSQVITIKLEMDARAPYRLTQDHAAHIEEIAHQLNAELTEKHTLKEKPINHILVVIADAFAVEIYAELSPSHTRPDVNTLDILQLWQTRTGQLEGATELTFTASEETAGGFAIELYSNDEESLHAASQSVLDYMQNIRGVSNLRDELKPGKPELYLQLKPEARHLGFDQDTLATQIGIRFRGAEAQRIQRNGEEIRVLVKDQQTSRDSISDLMQMRIKSDHDVWYPLTHIARIESRYATDYIARRDGKRVNTIRATIDKRVIAPESIADELFNHYIPQLQAQYPLVSVKQSGELEEITELKSGLIKALIITCLLIYALLATPLKSYWQPLIIMAIIPFGFVGAALGHWIMDLPFSFLSFLGMLALTGVVVNDALVLITRFNRLSADGYEIEKALIEAGTGRFKAIFLTTTTTVAGLIPLMHETSEQAQYLIPAAVSLAYGEIFATAITLILIPVLIAIGADIRQATVLYPLSNVFR